jgi:hypothetical protein
VIGAASTLMHCPVGVVALRSSASARSTSKHAAEVATGLPMFVLLRFGCHCRSVIVPTLVAAVALTATNCARSPNDVFFKTIFLYNSGRT